jgi:hypothetical protein
VAVAFSPIGNGFNFVNGVGSAPLSGGKIYTYSAGTTTPQGTYTTSAGSILNANPIILDAAGRPSNSGNPVEIWLTVGQTYKFVLTDSLDNQIASYDNLTGINDATGLVVSGITVNGASTLNGAVNISGTLTESGLSSFGNTVTITSNGTPTLASGYGASMAFAANMSSSTHRYFIGDGSGWKVAFASRNAGVTTDRATISDLGVMTVSGAVTFSSTLSIASTLTVVSGGVTVTAGGLTINSGDVTVANGGAFTFSSSYTGQLLYFLGGGDNTNVIFSNNSRALDSKQWGLFYGSDSSLRIRARKDDASSPVDFVKFSRSAAVVSGIELACLNVVGNSQNGNYTFVLTDAGKPIYRNAAGGGATWTVPPNSSVAFPIGTMLFLSNHDTGAATITIAQGAGVSIFIPGTAGAGNRTMGAENSACILMKFSTDAWMCFNCGGVT